MSELKCPTCGGPVLVGGKGDGTHWYEPVPDPAVARLVQAAMAGEWPDSGCPGCGNYWSVGHATNCWYAAALAPFRDADLQEPKEQP